MYEYHAMILRVVDGDTVDLSIDLGFGIFKRERVRLVRINAPELNTPAGKESATFLRNRLSLTDDVVIKTEKNTFDKYGRWLADIIHPTLGSISDYMLANNQAVPYKGA